jgi:hypothetical protein
MPKLSAACPERKLTMPILNVSCAMAEPAHMTHKAPHHQRLIAIQREKKIMANLRRKAAQVDCTLEAQA